jgi:hypothetical protein
MKLSLKNILLSLMICGGLLLSFGCTQKEDVVQSQESTTLTLDPDYLMELDSIYAYELWMVKVQNEGDDITASSAEFVSLGKFLWDNEVDRFRDLDGNAIGDEVELPESWYAFDYIVLTVENIDDPLPNEPSGVFMLVEEVIDPVTRPAVMKFPVSMFLATGFYFVGSPTDDTTFWDFDQGRLVRVSTNEEKGLWICSRFMTQRNLHDTLSVLSLDIVMVPDSFDTMGKYDVDTIGIDWPPDSIWTVIIDTVIYGYDTLQHRRIEIEWIDTVDTNYDYIRFPEFDIDSITSVGYPYPLGEIPYFEYAGPIEELLDINAYGWRYNAWVILEQPDPDVTDDNTLMDLAPVIPFGNGNQEAFVGSNSWGVLPLGAFGVPNEPDVSNQYIDNREVPQFPGEDFVVGADPRFDNLNLRRISDESWGYIIIGMEPYPPKLEINASSNFPLFILTAELPNGNAPNANMVHVFHNWSQFLPEINITVQMHD